MNNTSSHHYFGQPFRSRALWAVVTALLSLYGLQVAAQEDDDEWTQNARPEHIYNYAEGGVRRLPAKIGSRETASLRSTGAPKIPIVLVDFPDRPFHAAGQTPAEIVRNYELFFNGKDNAEVYEVTHSRGSVQSYFRDQSLGAFEPVFGIIGPVTLEKGYAEYGHNVGSVKDANISAFYREAMQKSVRELNVDWSQFDNDGNGTVDMVFFIHAGWGENTVQDIDADAIWAKESVSPMTVRDENGFSVVFSCYGVSAEARVRSASQLDSDLKNPLYVCGYNPANLRMDGIGVCIHELSHALGLPDFYDTNYVAFGMDAWSVMDYGEYVNLGYNPCGYTAYERDFMGWQPLVELTDSSMLSIACFADGGCGYKVVNDANEDEYYILENRQPRGWDDKLCTMGRGLMVTHVDYDAPAWNGNRVNTAAQHQRMTIIAANNNYGGTNVVTSSAEWKENLSGNLFPYTQPSQSLTDESSPAAVVYAGGLMHKPIYDITLNADSTVTACFLKSKAEFDKDFNLALQTLDADEYIDVYAMNGMHVCRCPRDEMYRITVRHGIYLVRFADGSVRKVMLK